MNDPINIIHVLMKMKDQETYFNGESYPHCVIGWKIIDEFHGWDGRKYYPEEIESWKAI